MASPSSGEVSSSALRTSYWALLLAIYPNLPKAVTAAVRLTEELSSIWTFLKSGEKT